MNFFTKDEVRQMTLPGVVSTQLINTVNCKDALMTLTDVIVQPDAIQPRHIHEFSEQTWYALEGCGVLLLADDIEKPFKAGDVARFEKNDVHGFRNNSDKPFRYISIACPPADFSKNYDKVLDK